MRRLYVIGQGATFRYCTADGFGEARTILGPTCRRPDPDDIRMVWKQAKIDTMSRAEMRQHFGVSHQAVQNWWRKAGSDLPRRYQHHQEQKDARLKAALVKHKGKCATLIAKAAGCSVAAVRRKAAELGITLPSWRRRPSDAELVKIAEGKTWPEFAEAVGLRMSTLRAYVYARPKLSARIAEVRAMRKTGKHSTKRVDPKKVRRLHKRGLSAYAISLKLGVEHMAIRYWIKRLALGGPNGTATRNGRQAVASVGGSDGGAELQQG